MHKGIGWTEIGEGLLDETDKYLVVVAEKRFVTLPSILHYSSVVYFFEKHIVNPLCMDSWRL